MYLIIKEPETKKDYENYFDIRWQILRRPWGQPRGSEKDGLEETSTHLMAYTENKIPVGAGRAHFNSETQAQIRFMAVVPDYRNNGIGGTLLTGLERRVKIGGAKYIVLNSRETAVGFYKKHGYSAEGRAMTLFGSVKHIKMRKDI
jgi:ribosomal protein S18 acetylase RimI-like enzyme